MPAGVRRVLYRAGLFLIPPFLLALQFLVGLSLQKIQQARYLGDEDRITFSVISIEPVRSTRNLGVILVGPELLEEDEEERGERGYEEENEMPTREDAGEGAELQPWSVGKPSFIDEVDRIVTYITTPQVNCPRMVFPGKSPASQAPRQPWILCSDSRGLPKGNPACVAYSFSMDGNDAEFLETVLGAGCEVHRFDPSLTTSGSFHSDTLEGDRSDRGVIQHHRAWLDWRSPRGRRQKKRGILGSGSRTLADIMKALGHQMVHFLYADLLSAEWRVLQNWAELGTLQSIRHLVVTGFEVGGTDAEVVRYWFSVLQALHVAGFRLVHSFPGEGDKILKQKVTNAHNSYTLSWVNRRLLHSGT
ncbi:LOW QUALITY PROTEIN: probable methyltransferase-like protein 24 [Hypomesus transpacificus]|uniref:LOW QUALITY PROTEIN: probable methyltransferase-like protein 24 n=1 Tax=Hypomesus transpacificus TaxID=137520 RepID=UPI001F071F40|nr:LOW QUALITY PROTEIN: probable methyltransferase-like protein 24 [Hypomesus transpacificus]